MKSFLILSFLFYLKASIISDTRLKNTMSDIKLQDQSDNFIKNEDRETKLIQAMFGLIVLFHLIQKKRLIIQHKNHYQFVIELSEQAVMKMI